MSCRRLVFALALAAALAACGASPQPAPPTADAAPADSAAGQDGGADAGADAAATPGDGVAGDVAVDAGADAAVDSGGDAATWSGGWQCPVAAEPACGGALEGTTWSIVDFCPEDPTAAAALFEHPFDNLPACKPPGGTVEGQLVDTGEIAFVDGEMILDIGGYAETTYTFSSACLAAVKPDLSAAAACAALTKPGLMSCALPDGGGVCTCQAKVPKEGGKSKLPYAIVGGTTLKAGNELSASYCVQGDRLLLDVSPHIVSWRWWLLRRK